MYTCSRLGLIDRRRRLCEEQQQTAGKIVSSLPTVTNQTPTSQFDIVTVPNNNFIEQYTPTSDTNKSIQQTNIIGVDNGLKPRNIMSDKNDEDVCYHHFALLYSDEQLKDKLSDVLFVLIAGSSSRAEAHSNYLEQLDLFKNNNWKLERLTNISGSRYNLFKVGPVLLANHGIGSASMSVALFEILLMCRAAGRLNKITVIRFGTCKYLH